MHIKGQSFEVLEEDLVGVVKRHPPDLMSRRRTALTAAQGLPAASLAAKILREGEVAGDHHWAAASAAGAQYLLGQSVAPGSAATGEHLTEPASFQEAVAAPRAASLDVLVTGDSTWCSVKNQKIRIHAKEKGVKFTKECIVRCTNGSSLVLEGQEPWPPALAEVRHEIEYEPDDRKLMFLCFPMTGGAWRSPDFCSHLELNHSRVLPEAYRLCALAELWEHFLFKGP